ncbi:MAG: SDR family oxidoreductase [Flavobacteriaceae bacterium]|nr:SDR family oxidoreductase [Flavobacteriaceae bacterium]
MTTNQKTAYITGGTKGIGFGIVKSLLEEGYQVAFSGRSQQGVDNALAALSDYKQQLLGIVSDVRKYADEELAVAKILDRFGSLDVVVANAGLGVFAPVDELDVEAFDQMIATNLNGVFYTLKASIPALKKSKGYYFSIASLAGTNFFGGGAGYNASKFGVVGFTQAAMIDLRAYGIKVTTIMPGSVTSEFNNHQPNENDAWKIQPEDIGQLVLDLLKMHPRALPSKIEIRPTQPGGKK